MSKVSGKRTVESGWRQNALLFLFSLWVILLTLYYFFSLTNEIVAQRKVHKANQDLRKIARVALQVYKNVQIPQDLSLLWKDLGMVAAPKDPWGQGYSYEHKGDKVLWQSAGPDGNRNTADDIVFVMPKVISSDVPPPVEQSAESHAVQ